MTTQSVSNGGALDSTYVNLINSIMASEQQPLNRLTSQRDTITVQKGVFTDLSTMLTSFQGSTTALISTNANYALQSGRNSTITPATSGTTVLSASVGTNAVPGEYDISVTSLAKAHRVRSDSVEYINQPLNMTGSFVIGGAADHSYTVELDQQRCDRLWHGQC